MNHRCSGPGEEGNRKRTLKSTRRHPGACMLSPPHGPRETPAVAPVWQGRGPARRSTTATLLLVLEPSRQIPLGSIVTSSKWGHKKNVGDCGIELSTTAERPRDPSVRHYDVNGDQAVRFSTNQRTACHFVRIIQVLPTAKKQVIPFICSSLSTSGGSCMYCTSPDPLSIILTSQESKLPFDDLRDYST